jgi:hypothetical protein
MALKYNSTSRKSPWRPASSEINGLCFRSVHFYLPLFEVMRQGGELRLEPIADIYRFWVGHKNGSVICKCHKLTPIGRGASEVNKLYKVGDKTAPWGTPYGILQTDDLDLPNLTWKVRPLSKECTFRARKILKPPWMSLWWSALCQTESKAFSTSKRSMLSTSVPDSSCF